MAWTDATARAALRSLFDAALGAADPLTCLAPHLPPSPADGRVVVVGCGKAAAKMAAAVEAAWPEVPLTGLVVTTYGADLPVLPPSRRIAVHFASHPVPDANGAAAAAAMLEAVRGLGPEDLVRAAGSGGASGASADAGDLRRAG
jgi:glycerate-2-kinase